MMGGYQVIIWNVILWSIVDAMIVECHCSGTLRASCVVKKKVATL